MQNNISNSKRKTGFYIAVGSLVACVALVGVLYTNALNKRTQEKNADLARNQQKTLSLDNATPAPDSANLDAKTAQADGGKAKNSQKLAKADTQKNEEDKQQSEDSSASASADKTAENETAKDTAQAEEPAEPAMANGNASSSFKEENGLLWPVDGDVIMKYSMNNSIYFATLAQYKCNPAIVISCEENTPVKAAADCMVTSIEEGGETGLTVCTSVGDSYTVKYGQLKDVSVTVGDRLQEGDTLGKIAKPSKYYSVEGANLYFQILENNKSIDPLLLLR